MRKRRIPLIRLGLLLIVGAAVTTAFSTYVRVGQSAADMSADDRVTDRAAIIDDTVRRMTDPRAVPGLMCIAGAGLIVLGILRLALPRR